MANSRGYPEISATDDPDVPGDMNALAQAVAADVSKSGVKWTPTGSPKFGAVWNGTSPIEIKVFEVAVTSDSGGNCYITLPSPFPNALLGAWLQSSNAGLTYAKPAVYHGASLTTKTQIAFRLDQGGAAVPNTTCWVSVLAVGW